MISKGIYENVLVIGIDTLSHTTVCGFSALSVLSSKLCTPFDKNREGMNVSEGFGILYSLILINLENMNILPSLALLYQNS